MSNVFEDISESFAKAHRIVGQMVEETQQDKTIIIHPQLGKDEQEAQRLAGDWQYKKKKQLFDNLYKELS